jgi:hypothetical protein
MSDDLKEVIEQRAQRLVEMARQAGYVITIETKPLEPFAMGHYEMQVEVRKARHE